MQVGFSRQGVAQVIREAADGLDKKMASMGQRVRKHLDSDNSAVYSRVQDTLRTSLLAQYAQFEADFQACYPDLRLDLTLAQLEPLLKYI